MKTATVKLKGISPISFSKHISVPKLNKELPKDYEARTWGERVHYDENNEIFIPGSMLKNCISETAKFLGIQIPGKGKQNYTKNFEAGVMCFNPIYIGVKKEDVGFEWLFVPADGRRGGTTRVEKCFPLVPSWSGVAEFTIVDSTITEDVFLKHLQEAGSLVGLGRFRPRKNGYYGRFIVESIKWSDNEF